MERVSENSFFVAVTSDPSSGVESGGELEIANQWLEKRIEKEIQKGAKLREVKLHGPPKGLKLARDNNRIPSSSAKDVLLEMQKRARSISPLQKKSHSRDARSTSGARTGPMCSMRISELAAPSKRQVIDTWRNKAAVLPEFMVYRLRQQVFDQKPIVQVTDAVNCFKNERKSTTRRPPKKINKEGMMRRTMTENQRISTIFGHKIAQKLITPMSIKLDNAYYKNISTIVADDIYTLVKDRRRLRADDTTDARMVNEVADKVTVWIASILDDTSEKLLEEDLKVNKMRDRTSANDAELITLIGRMACKEAELEEQEGPVLDLLDDLVVNVVDSFKTESVSSLSHLSCYEGDQEDDEKYKIDALTPGYISATSRSDEDTELKDTLRKETEALPIPGSLDNIFEEIRETKSDYNLNTYLKNQINEIIASNAFRAQSLDEERSESGQSAKTASDRSQPDEDENNAIPKDQTPSIIDSVASIYSQKRKHGEKLETDDNIDPVITENQDNSNVSDALEILDQEYEERNKKVQFSQADVGALMEMNQFGSISRNQEPNSLTREDLQVHTVKEITYAPPNEHVLSDADDLWPDNISPFAIKPSASVSKSITSMGRLLESDEINVHTPEEEQSQDLLKQPKESVELQDIEIQDDLKSEAPQPLDRQSQNLLQQPQESVNLQDQDIEIKEDLISEAPQPLERHSQDVLSQPQESLKLQEIEIKDDLIPEAPQPLARHSQDVLPQPQESLKLQEIEIKDDLIPEALQPLERHSQDVLPQPQESLKLQEIEIKEDLIPEAPRSLESKGMPDIFDPVYKNNESDALHSNLHDGSTRNVVADLISKPKLDLEEYLEILGKNDGDQMLLNDLFSTNQEQPFQQERDKNSIGSSEYLDLHFDFDLVEKNESTLKQSDIRDKIDSSQESFASLVVGELKKCGDVLQGITTDREQAKTQIDTTQLERSKSIQYIKRNLTSSKTHQRYLSAHVRHTNKFDYRVHQKTAPAWIRRGQGEPSGGCQKRCGCQTDVPKSDGVKTFCSKWRCPDPPVPRTMQQREYEIRKWCRDLDDILLNLSKCKNWLDYITGYINNLKQKAEYNKLNKPNDKMHRAASLSNRSKSANKDVWTKLNQRAKGGLKLYKLDDFDDTIKFKNSRSQVPAKYCARCGKRQTKRLSRSPLRK